MGKVWDALRGLANGVENTARSVANAVENTVHNVVKDPVRAIETIALTAVIGPEGLALTATETGAAAVASAAVTAANGGSVKDIATAGLTAYAGGMVGEQTGFEVAKTGTTSDALVKISSSAASGYTQATLTALSQGKSLKDALEIGAKAGVTAGLTSGAVQGITTFVNEPGQVGAAPIEERSTSTTGETVTQGIEPSTVVSTGQNVKQEPLIGSQSEKFIGNILGPSIYKALFAPSAPSFGGQTTSGTQGTTAQATPTTPTATPTQTTVSPGSQALAQALRIGDVGAPIFGGDKEGGKKSGWNVESLRYMGNPEA